VSDAQKNYASDIEGHPDAPANRWQPDEQRLTYLAFIPGQCVHCGADFNAHIPSGERDVYYCPEWALRERWGDK
jgi:hypothetical protein